MTRPALVLLVLLATVPALAGPPRPTTDAEIAKLIAAAGDEHDGAPFVVALEEGDVLVEPTGLATTRSTRVVKILTDAGARSHAVLREGFDPNTNRVSIDRVRIHRKDV